MCLCVKYHLLNGRVGVVIQGDQDIFGKCYVESLKLKRILTPGGKSRRMSLGIKPPEEFRMGEESSSPYSEDIEGGRSIWDPLWRH